jgi:hypothetical protein
MNLPKYQVSADDERFLYEFFSEGPKGSIKKTVIYSEIEDGLFNLAFGDWNDELNKLDDSIRSNNGDRDKILATVASTAIDFTDRFPQAEIFTEGSTPARTRLYQIGISNNLVEISEDFEIQGYIDHEWQPFRKGINYEAFLIQRK